MGETGIHAFIILGLFSALRRHLKERMRAHVATNMFVYYEEGVPRRSFAADALSEIGTEARVAIPALIEALKDQDRFVRISAAKGLGKMGTEAKAAVPPLIELLKDSEPLVRANAAEALGRMGAEAKTAILALTELQKDQAPVVRLAAAGALGKINASETKP